MQILCRLLAHPEYIEPIREEIDAVISKEGWTIAAIDKMDSFLRETQVPAVDDVTLRSLDSFLASQLRDADSLSASSYRSILEPSRVAPIHNIHIFQWCDRSCRHTNLHPVECRSRIFTNPDVFDGFRRFAKLREIEGDKTTSIYQTVARFNEYLSF